MTDNREEDKRRHPRYPIYCPLEYKGEDAQPKEASVTLNISEGGALISARRHLSVASNVILKFKLRDELFFVIGKVRHVRHHKERDAYEIGVEFWDRPRTFAKKFYEELDEIKELKRRHKEEKGLEMSLTEASMNRYQDLKSFPQ